MSEQQTNSTQPNAPFLVRKQAYDPNYQFVPQAGARKSPIPERFEGPVPIVVNR